MLTSFIRALALRPALSILVLLGLASSAFGQQAYIGRYSVYTGYTNLQSPAVGLNENGFHLQAGINPKAWYALGFDYSTSRGDLILTPSVLTAADQQSIAAAIALYGPVFGLPANFQLKVPAHSFTQTFAAGPQYEIHHFKKTTIFLRPSIGAIRERATPQKADGTTGPGAFTNLIISQLAPSGSRLDWVGFYGAGGGVDVNVAHHFGVRMQVDYVHDHLFDDLLANGRNTVRFSVGPSFHFGKNIVR